MAEIVIDYNNDLEQLLKIHAEECESLSILHRQSFEKYNKQSNYINIPVIILSSAIGFATGIDIGYDKMNIILGVSSIFVGIIKSIDTYFQLGKRSESHRLCSLQFMQITKKLQIELSLHRGQRQSAKDMLHIIKTDIKNLQDIAPLIDQDIIDAYNTKYGQYTTVKKPNFVNGLTEVVINSGLDDIRRNSVITHPYMDDKSLRVKADLVYTPSNHASPQPSNHVSPQPSKHTTPQPSKHATPQPSKHATPQPSNHVSPQPSKQPSKQPSINVTPQPSKHATPQPSKHVSPQPSNQPSKQPSKQPSINVTPQQSNVPTPNKSTDLDMDELNSAIQALQSQLTEQENTQPLLNETNVIDIPDNQPYEAHTQSIDETILREQIRALLIQQNIPDDQMEDMIQYHFNNIHGAGDEGMM